MNDVLLVDDESAVLEGLTNALDWAEFGFKHVLSAQSAQEAMLLMRDHPVDLLLLDILMPGMNGLEMLKTIRSRYPRIHCVLISAHSKFEYAQEAIRLNVENYLLKPVDLNELRETVYRAVENINQDAESFHNLFERNVLERWLYGRITTDELVEHSRFTGYNVLMRRYFSLCVRGKSSVDACLRALVSALQVQYPAYLLSEEGEGFLLTGGRDITWDILSQLLSPVASAFPGLVISCGSCANGSGEVNKSLTDARIVQEYARLTNRKGFLAYDEISENMLSIQQLSSLNDALSAQAPERKVSEWVRISLGHGENSESTIRHLYAITCLAMLESAKETISQDVKLPVMAPPYTPDHLQQALKEAVSLLSSAQERERQDYSPVVNRMIHYINENLTGALSIKQFCAQSKTNAAYIGRLFKEETGMYFSDYVSILRIRKAKLLLSSSNQAIGDIARQVGIYDVSYFTQCFKKQERMSPTQYRQSLQNTK
ncbi:MAG: response regulator [Clostridia bacterium]|nr:response regulator [Clostridia bacterium]